MRESFSSNTKKELLEELKFKKCCAFSLIYGFAYIANEENDVYILKKTNVENAMLLSKAVQSTIKNKQIDFNEKTKEISMDKGIVRFFTIDEYEQKVFKCELCMGMFLRAIFLVCGTVNDPNKSYRLELVFDEEKKQLEINELLERSGFCPKLAMRKGKYILYFRNSEQIENFLAMIGATNATFTVMNSKIFKDVTNNVNRVANCDSANISKAIKASEKYISAILNLIESGKIESLPDQLRDTAYKRIEFRELNFEQLGKKFSPPISKSGIYHRLEKILNFYNENK